MTQLKTGQKWKTRGGAVVTLYADEENRHWLFISVRRGLTIAFNPNSENWRWVFPASKIEHEYDLMELVEDRKSIDDVTPDEWSASAKRVG